MKFLAILVLIFCVGFTAAGCRMMREYYLHLPDNSSEWRAHPLGMRVYNMSGEEMSEGEWDLRFYTIDTAYAMLKKCLGTKYFAADEAVRKAPIVILPSRKPGTTAFAPAYTDLRSLFIVRDVFSANTLRAEWVHIYLWERHYFWGDRWHRHPLFKTCWYEDVAF